MRVQFHIGESSQAWARPYVDALAEGIKLHGDEVAFVDTRHEGRDCDVAVTWGAAGQRGDAMRASLAGGVRHLIMERGYVGNRLNATSLGFDGLNGRALFPTSARKRPSHAFLRDLMQPWGSGAGYALIMGQVTGDATIQGIDMSSWLIDRVRELKAAGMAVRFRPHPIMRRAMLGPPGSLQGREFVRGAVFDDRELPEALAGAGLVVTYNSTSGVDALLAGAAVSTWDEGSMVWSRSAQRSYDTLHPDRTRWLDSILAVQWTIREMKDGWAWAALKRVVAGDDPGALGNEIGNEAMDVAPWTR